MGEIPTKPRKVSEETNILNEITEMLEANGEMDQETRDHLMLRVMKEVIRRMSCLGEVDERITVLERRNIATAFIQHPITMILLTFTIFLVLNMIAHSFSVVTLLGAILRALGIPVPPL
jgi:hypothetical protein